MNTVVTQLARYLLAVWHLRRSPLADASDLERARWCRDHCGQFAGRWFAFGAAFWLIFSTPFVASPVLAFLGLFGLIMGMWHISWQIIAQKKAGLPPIE